MQAIPSRGGQTANIHALAARDECQPAERRHNSRMRRATAGLRALIGLLALAGAARAQILVDVTLPLCEPSGIAAVAPDRFVIVDDEEQRNAFVVTLAGKVLGGVSKLMIPRTKDLEAVAGRGDQVILIGSHSRRSDAQCSVDGRRMRALAGRIVGDALHDQRRLSWLGRDDGALKKDALADARGALFQSCDAANQPVCAVIAGAEAAAAGDPLSCVEALNIEGATVASGRLWLGLRAPRFDTDAILLRVAGDPGALEALALDGWARLDLGGRGVRGLSANATHLYGIAGPVGDAAAGGFSLFRLPLTALIPGARLTPKIVGGLPPKAEGIAVLGDRIAIVTDGESPANGGACPTPGRLLIVKTPAP